MKGTADSGGSGGYGKSGLLIQDRIPPEGQVGPPNLGVGDYHSLRSKMRWAADETNSSS